MLSNLAVYLVAFCLDSFHISGMKVGTILTFSINLEQVNCLIGYAIGFGNNLDQKQTMILKVQ